MAYQELHCASRGGLESCFKVILSMHPHPQELQLFVWILESVDMALGTFPGTISQEMLRRENIMLQRTLRHFYGSSGGSLFPTLINTATWGKSSAALVPTCPSDPTPCGTVQSLLWPSAWKNKPCLWCERAPKNLSLITPVTSFPEPGRCLD